MRERSAFSDDASFRLGVQELYEQLLEQLEMLLEELDPQQKREDEPFEPLPSSGSLTINFEDGSVFMLSQQTPTHEIWLSANYTAWHFLKENNKWVERDTLSLMDQVLSNLFSEKLGLEVEIQL
jgi:iron donor protein CyaY